MNSIIRTLLVGLVTVCLSAVVSAATFGVNTTADTQDANPGDGVCADAGSQCSFRAAITEANALAGTETINVPAGFYTQSLIASDENANDGGDWDITSSLTINGAGAEATVFQAANAPGIATERVIEVGTSSPTSARTVRINDVMIRYGNKTGAPADTTRGGGIRNGGTLFLKHVNVFDNSASGAGGIRNEGGLTLDFVNVQNNTCNNGGSTCFGGGIYTVLSGQFPPGVTIRDSSIINNRSIAPGTDGVAYAAGIGMEGNFSALSLTDSVVSGNQGTGNGNGGSSGNGIRILPQSGSASFNIQHCTFENNSGSGGTTHLGSGIAGFAGSGSINGSISNSTFKNNSATTGGVLFMNAAGKGLAITIKTTTMAENSATVAGGAIAMTNAGAGSGQSNAHIYIENSTLSGNTAGSGGAIYAESPADGPPDVGVSIGNSTIFNNQASIRGGGYYSPDGDSSTGGSIIAGNSSPLGPDISGHFYSSDYNHIGTTSGATFEGNTFFNTFGDPQLGPLQNNGGPTLTHMPSAASPVVNSIPSGTNFCVGGSMDQRGFPRQVGNGCDKGSVERLVLAAGPWNLSGTIRDSGGRPIANVIVILTGGSLTQPRFSQSGSLGIYSFPDLPGDTYQVSLSSKRYTFSADSQMVNLASDMPSIDFNADPGGGLRLGGSVKAVEAGRIFDIDAPLVMFNERDRSIEGGKKAGQVNSDKTYLAIPSSMRLSEREADGVFRRQSM